MWLPVTLYESQDKAQYKCGINQCANHFRKQYRLFLHSLMVNFHLDVQQDLCSTQLLNMFTVNLR